MIKKELTTEDTKALQSKRDFLQTLLAGNSEEHNTAAEKLTLLNLLFRQKTFSTDHEFQVDSMGVFLGDALCQVLGLKWVMVDKGDSIEPAVCFPGTMIFTFPLDVIRKRIERNEEVDVFYIFVGIAEAMNKMRQSGNYKKD